MKEFLIAVGSAVTAAIVINSLGLSKPAQRIEIVGRRRIGWFWKLMVLVGGFLFYFGLLIFIPNLAVSGMAAYNTRLGLAFVIYGALIWVVSRLVIYFKKD